MASKSLFLTKTALGAYGAVLASVMVSATVLAKTYDEKGSLSATDWVTAGGGVGLAIASQLVSLGGRLDPNQAPAYTPPFLPGPNKEDIKNERS